MSGVPSKARLLQLAQVQAKIFNQVFNPTGERTGAKYLKQKLKGDVIKSYYGPTEFITTKQLNAKFPMYKFVDPEEEYRLDILASRKRRGKGAPAKKREAPSADSKKKKK
ncbi:CYFA0S03e00848g1_1 [Cyberlindnera fabianii]|uniref:Small ribosomal subunit protein mS33 n=1 Tax=Cyberlindnera fabianii TaxID=36022 RepID=A0A061ANM0_CYBFA|nr:hypothetical protein BON22_4581 [Cyberlindnera fabianii]CDR39207.1 CYFA0S03e00848g1_1 [Cyberlindnera fabianii]